MVKAYVTLLEDNFCIQDHLFAKTTSTKSIIVTRSDKKGLIAYQILTIISRFDFLCRHDNYFKLIPLMYKLMESSMKVREH